VNASTRLPLFTGSFGGLLLIGAAVATVGLGAALLLCADVLLPLASACLQACADNPVLMSAARGIASLLVALAGAGILAGTVAVIRQVVSTRRLVRQIEGRSSHPAPIVRRLAAEVGLEGRLTYVVDPAPYAFCYGFLSPRVCVSSGMARSLTGPELRAVLLHEGFHARQRDPLKVLVSRGLGSALFMLPTAAEMRDRYLVRKELDADAHVVERLSPQPLAAALLKIARPGSRQPVAQLATAAVGPFNVTRERIQHLAYPGRRSQPLSNRNLAVSFVVALLLLLATAGSSLAAEHSLPAGGTCCGSSSLCDVPATGGQATQ
jgi:beta-lactamase regulating signal transducer with metallopeptidase domain